MPQYLSPRNDYSFKTLFGRNHKNLTMSFLNAILGKIEGNLIKEIIFRETEQIPELARDRRSFLDVYCTDETGKHFIIEMQNDPQDFFFERMIYYASLIFSRQRARPFSYEKLTPVIFIGILSKELNNDHPDVISEHAIMNTKYNTVSSEHMMYYLVELGKFNKTEEELETDIDKWLFFMKNADEYKDIPVALQNNTDFKEAFHILEHMAFSEVDFFSYLAAQDAEAKLASAINQRAKAERQMQETEILIKEAEIRAKETALNFLRMGISVEKVVQGTGLSIEEVEKLQKKMR